MLIFRCFLVQAGNFYFNVTNELDNSAKILYNKKTVSYTHLTLPTIA